MGGPPGELGSEVRSHMVVRDRIMFSLDVQRTREDAWIATGLYVNSGAVRIRVVMMDEADNGRLMIQIERRCVRRYTSSGCGRAPGRV